MRRPKRRWRDPLPRVVARAGRGARRTRPSRCRGARRRRRRRLPFAFRAESFCQPGGRCYIAGGLYVITYTSLRGGNETMIRKLAAALALVTAAAGVPPVVAQQKTVLKVGMLGTVDYFYYKGAKRMADLAAERS